jgi:predicted hydrolase (HD superfamily)
VIISREEALALVRKYIRDQELFRNSLAVEALLKELAKKLQKDEELWGLVGLLHNLDYEYTNTDPEKRGRLSSQLLEGILPEDAINAIKANNYIYTSCIPTTTLDKTLITAEATTGFIFASTQAVPSKNIMDLDSGFLLEKFNDPNFAPEFNRNRIRLCVDVGFELGEYLVLCLKILQLFSSNTNK